MKDELHSSEILKWMHISTMTMITGLFLLWIMYLFSIALHSGLCICKWFSHTLCLMPFKTSKYNKHPMWTFFLTFNLNWHPVAIYTCPAFVVGLLLLSFLFKCLSLKIYLRNEGTKGLSRCVWKTLQKECVTLLSVYIFYVFPECLMMLFHQ